MHPKGFIFSHSKKTLTTEGNDKNTLINLSLAVTDLAANYLNHFVGSENGGDTRAIIKPTEKS